MTKNGIVKTDGEIIADEIPAELRAHLSGEHALQIFKDDLAAAGVRMPEDYQFKVIDKKALQATHSAVFSLMGGIPSYILWAARNPDKFYSNWMKIDSKEVSQTNIGIVGGGNGITITTGGLPSTPLDTIELDAQGKIIDNDLDDLL